MNPSVRVALLAAALLCAAVAAPAAAVRLPGLNWGVDICETFSKDECAEHADTCILCKAWDKVDVCFETEIAKRLPAKLFNCSWSPEPQPSPSPVPSPEPQPSPEPVPVSTDCQDHKDEDSCSDSDNCVWCLSAAVPSACYTTEEAKRLPAAVFQCKFPSYLAVQ